MTYLQTNSYNTEPLSPKQKASIINSNKSIYGTFAEIGAGQETVRHFFRAMFSSQTIAKAMSAYDKDFSDDIYGTENQGYVSEHRLRNMLNHEKRLIEKRLNKYFHKNKTFFTYANTVATINIAKRYKGHGWVGIMFQMGAWEPYNEIIIHIRFKEDDPKLQQETLGIMGVNLIYGCYYLNENPKRFIMSLYDNISNRQLEIDSINFYGPRFSHIDNRLMSLQLVKNGMTDAVIFGPDNNNILPSRILYKKNILTMRGSFRPVTKTNLDMLEKGKKNYYKSLSKAEQENTEILFEITLNNLKSSNEDGYINEKDFLDRANILRSLGYNVLISNFSEYYKLVDYFHQFTKNQMGLIMGVNNFKEIFNEKYYSELSGGILEAFGKLFTRKLRIYLYPYKTNKTLLNTSNIIVKDSLKDLYKYFKLNRRVVDIPNFDEKALDYHSREVLKMIRLKTEGWEDMLPDGVSKIIKENNLFGYNI